MTMPEIRCINTDKQGNYHVMSYQDHGYKHPDNGYYCKICDYVEKDDSWMDRDDMLDSQERRVIENEY